MRHAVSELLGGHRHEATERVDDALEADAAGRQALVVSVVGLGVTAAAQAVVAVASGSVALLSDTVHNGVDALTAVPLFVAFALASRPATRRFTYGYGRAEDLAGILIVIAIAASAVLAGWAAVDRLLDPRPVTHLLAVAAAGLVGFAGNELVARYRIRVGRRIGSAALVADGLHARTDGFTSLAVLLSAGGLAVGLPLADPIIGLLIAVAILAVLRDAAREVFGRIMDAVDPALVDAADHAVTTVPGVREVPQLRLRWIGHTLRAEVDLAVDPGLTVMQAHGVAAHAEQHLTASVPRLTAATITTSPAREHAGPSSRGLR
ncbi:cation diffusion facilitator family transporter [Geodermatophilus sp. DSM 45219]|uniref:cation diffusion facilitator family transporter n=1 Tax=Geodermatophilus sp. DSM 45219 TaxID=1881103 RepID=UPI000883B43E|nr:cation diffusion facilitator family transporter [Geodermatophilus sp. DSM 45219]SDO13042.1 cation diffusion facilitator family transporter [Geodermatophilus sp. DSM 45219]